MAEHKKYKICPVCNKGFPDNYKLKRHMGSHTRSNPKPVNKDKVRVEGKCKCTECGKGFDNNYSLQRHMNSHNGVKPFQCEICNRQFTRKDSLHDHMNLHTNEKPFTCHLCSEGFSSRGKLRMHVIWHTDATPYKCDECDRAFKCTRSLRRHKETHLPEDQRKLKRIVEKLSTENVDNLDIEDEVNDLELANANDIELQMQVEECHDDQDEIDVPDQNGKAIDQVKFCNQIFQNKVKIFIN